MNRNKRRNSSPKITNLTESIIRILKEDHNKSFNYKQICAQLDVDDSNSRNQVIKKLQELKAQEQVIEPERGKYQLVPNRNYHTGILDVSGKGGGYVMVADMDQDIYVPPHHLNKALNGDEVEVYIYRQRRSKKHEGEIVKIIKRKTEEFVGVIDIQKKFAFVHTSVGNKMYTDVFVPLNKIGKAENGDKVVVKMEDWPDKADSPFGMVTKVLGKPGEHNTEIHSILAQYGLPYEFPEEVEAYANKIDTSIKADEIAKRRDMRDVLTFTIDPKDAKDFDDALSFQKLENGNYEIGIHIADVSHYLVPGTILDDEAYERATSVYLVDRVVPMLPEVLSNGACSLRPNEEKYTFSAVFEMDPATTKIVNQWFGRTVTYSDARFAYEEAQAIIDSRTSTIPSDISITGKRYKAAEEVVEATLEMNRMAKIMRKQRMKNGAISFDKVEVKFDLDEEANPVGVFSKTHLCISHSR
jgi:VacB/RNase II family 3'-5' exoribonuclease